MTPNKIPLEQIEKMTSSEISAYLEEITQTKICADAKYCKQLLAIFLSKPLVNI